MKMSSLDRVEGSRLAGDGVAPGMACHGPCRRTFQGVGRARRGGRWLVLSQMRSHAMRGRGGGRDASAWGGAAGGAGGGAWVAHAIRGGRGLRGQGGGTLAGPAGALPRVAEVQAAPGGRA